jgi:hypothetical protein
MSSDVDDILNRLIARVHRVRCWLLALGVLKSAAVGLACLCAYIGLYAWIDHHAHFNHWGRLTALLVLVLLLAGLGWLLVRMLRRDMKDSHAASYIEGRHSFEQQLVAAVEYFEGQSDYPYSRLLAARLVRQVDAAAREFRFDSVIDKWQHYVLAGCIFLGLLVVGVFLSRNVFYLSCYLGRLLQPFARIEPVPDTVFESVTQDTVAARDTPLTLTAAVHGRTPESATLVLTRQSTEDADDATQESQRVRVNPTVDTQGNTTFSATTSFPTLGQLTYRFETEDAVSEPHTIKVCEPPAVKSITATVSRPETGHGSAATDSQPVQDGTVQALPHSAIEFQIESTVPLREATVVTAGGKPQTLPLNNAQAFTFRFTADEPSDLELKLVSTDGLPNRVPQRIRVQLKSDRSPQFRLLVPEGDYLTTDVASVPIAFDISDDFGLDSAELCCEFPDGHVTVLDTQSPGGAKHVSVTHTLELEQYPVKVGDSILFYAKAKDIDTGQRKTNTGVSSSSEIYFIEIRPYRQYWHPEQSGGKPQPGIIAEDLMAILEYTRAMLKKSWVLADEAPMTAERRSRMETLRGEARHCAEQLRQIRDDPDYGFTEPAQAELSRIIERYERGSDALDRRDAVAALAALKDAYRLLRQFIDELHLKWIPPQSGQSPPPPQERIRLQEQPQNSSTDQERTENQLQELQRKIEKLAREQKSLHTDLKDTLRQQQTAESASSSGSSSSGSPSGSRSEPSAAQSSQPQSDTASQETGRRNRQEAQDKETPGPDSQPDGGKGDPAKTDAQSPGAQPSGRPQSPSGQAKSQKGNGSEDAPGSAPGVADQTTDRRSNQSQSPGTPSGAGGSAEAQSSGAQPSGRPQSPSGQAGSQKGNGSEDAPGSAPGAADQTTDRRSNQSQSPGTPSGAGSSAEAADARLRMVEARQKALHGEATQVQADLQQLPVSESSPQGRTREQAQRHVGQAVEKMTRFEEKLTQTRYDPSISTQKMEDISELADSVARELVEAGKAIRQGLSAGKPPTTGTKARDMAEQLAEDAEALDESLSPADRQRMLERLEAAQHLLETMAGPQWATVSGGGTPGGGHVYTKDAFMAPADAARMLARQFWSIALDAREKGLPPVADEPSDVEFFQAESEFFEAAATYTPPGTEQ